MHDSYWLKVKVEAAARIGRMFARSHVDLCDVVGDDGGVDSREDAERVLAYVLRHGDCRERACAIVSVGEWVHASHELAEHGAAGAAAVK